MHVSATLLHRVCPPSTGQSPINLGYAGDNLTLRRTHRIFTSRSCHKGTFEREGLDHVSGLALKNCRDLLPLLQWNHAHDIHFFRISSQIFPWAGQYELEELPDFEDIVAALSAAGKYARSVDQRLTAHPPHFIKLASTDEAIRKRSVADIEVQSRVFDLMGYEKASHWNKINIHVGGAYGSKTRTLHRFSETFEGLKDSTRARLTVENDDRPKGYSVADLMILHSLTRIPITFDFFHHQFCPGAMTQKEAFEAALSTWPTDVRPVVHWSEAPECPQKRRLHPYGHSSFVYGPIELFGRDREVDVMLESKAKEAALLLYRDEISLRYTTAPLEAVEEECLCEG